MLRGVTISEGEEAFFLGGDVPTSLTSNSCELDWSMQRTHRGRRLIASVGRVYYWSRRGCTPRVKSDINNFLVLVYNSWKHLI